MSEQKNLTFLYKFKFENDENREFPVELDPKTLAVIQAPKKSYPDWTKLNCQQCNNCPLENEEYCPIAINIVDLMEAFKNEHGNKTVDVTITTDSRNYEKQVNMQTALSSILGIYMVTSGCPIMDKLRPMVRTHLPFSSPEETMYRAMTMYLTAQYFINKNNGKPDWDMENLKDLFEEINMVNFSFRERLKQVKTEDAGLNAVVQLDHGGMNVALSLSGEANEQMLKNIEHLFKN